MFIEDLAAFISERYDKYVRKKTKDKFFLKISQRYSSQQINKFLEEQKAKQITKMSISEFIAGIGVSLGEVKPIYEEARCEAMKEFISNPGNELTTQAIDDYIEKVCNNRSKHLRHYLKHRANNQNVGVVEKPEPDPGLMGLFWEFWAVRLCEMLRIYFDPEELPIEYPKTYDEFLDETVTEFVEQYLDVPFMRFFEYYISGKRCVEIADVELEKKFTFIWDFEEEKAREIETGIVDHFLCVSEVTIKGQEVNLRLKKRVLCSKLEEDIIAFIVNAKFH
ncbi:MAG: hypothetical protein ACOX6Q_00575 [Candidatus Dojkabacteria bacterium]|jgi:hypothetical protein